MPRSRYERAVIAREIYHVSIRVTHQRGRCISLYPNRFLIHHGREGRAIPCEIPSFASNVARLTLLNFHTSE